MIARLGAKAVLLVMALALVFFGAGMLVLAVAEAFVPLVGPAWADAIAGAIFVVPVLLWAMVVSLFQPRRPPPERSGFAQALLSVLFKDTPWFAILGAGLAGAAEMFLYRNKRRK